MSIKKIVFIMVICYLMMTLPDGIDQLYIVGAIGAIGELICLVVLAIKGLRMIAQYCKDTHTIAENSKREH